MICVSQLKWGIKPNILPANSSVVIQFEIFRMSQNDDVVVSFTAQAIDNIGALPEALERLEIEFFVCEKLVLPRSVMPNKKCNVSLVVH